MEKKQSSIDWLEQQIKDVFYVAEASEMTKKFKSVFEQAKAMHKEEIIRAYQQGDKDGTNYEEFLNEFEVYGSRYYTKTFGGDNEN